MQHTFERFFADLATEDLPDEKAPSRLKSRIYSALMQQQAESGPLLGLSQTQAAGHHLCVFEALTNLCPVESINRLNLCRVCHARVLGETVERAPIFWHNCPYVDFQNR